jgi:hypothetical protein
MRLIGGHALHPARDAAAGIPEADARSREHRVSTLPVPSPAFERTLARGCTKKTYGFP